MLVQQLHKQIKKSAMPDIVLDELDPNVRDRR